MILSDIDVLYRLNRLRQYARKSQLDLPPREDIAAILGCPREQLDHVVDAEQRVVIAAVMSTVGYDYIGSGREWIDTLVTADLKHVLSLVSAARGSVLQELAKIYHAAGEAEFGDRARTWKKAEEHVAALRARCAKGGDL